VGVLALFWHDAPAHIVRYGVSPAVMREVMDEEKQRTIAEAEVRRMESEEAFLIDRLKATQEEQRTAYDQLESALNYDLVPEPEY